jgi:hypothetical protein
VRQTKEAMLRRGVGSKFLGLVLGASLLACGGVTLEEDFTQQIDLYFEASFYEIYMDVNGKSYEGELTRVIQDGFTVTMEGLMWNKANSLENYPIALELTRRGGDGTFYFDGEVLPPEFSDFTNDIDYRLNSFNRIRATVFRSNSDTRGLNFDLLALDPGRTASRLSKAPNNLKKRIRQHSGQ